MNGNRLLSYVILLGIIALGLFLLFSGCGIVKSVAGDQPQRATEAEVAWIWRQLKNEVRAIKFCTGDEPGSPVYFFLKDGTPLLASVVGMGTREEEGELVAWRNVFPPHHVRSTLEIPGVLGYGLGRGQHLILTDPAYPPEVIWLAAVIFYRHENPDDQIHQCPSRFDV